jgi:hypothetical protein
MSSKNRSNCEPECKRIPFRLSALNKHVPRKVGIYAFWFGNYCVYIGKTEKQSLLKRLLDHWEGTHNPQLHLWIAAKRDSLLVAFLEVDNPKQIGIYERYYIRIFQPLTNKVRYN